MIVIPEHWGKSATLERVLSGAEPPAVDLLEATLVSGRVLRSSRGTAAERDSLRRQLVRLIRPRLEALDAAWRPRADAALGALEGWAKVGSRLDALLELLWLRDDLESVRMALMMARLDTVEDNELPMAARLNRSLDELGQRCAQLDLRADEELATMRRVLAWSALTPVSRASLEALGALVSCADNPWWLELVDPVFMAAAKQRGFVVRVREPEEARARVPAHAPRHTRLEDEASQGLRAAAATAGPQTEREYDLGAGVSLCLFVDARGGHRALVAGLDAEADHELFWDGPAAGAARLERTAELKACELPDGFVLAEHVGLRRQDA